MIPLATNEVYDPVTNTWETKAPMDTARCGLTVSAVNGKIYAIGGGDYQNGPADITVYTAVEEYDPETDTWTLKSPMPVKKALHTAHVIDNKIYVFGGAYRGVNNGEEETTLLAYDPAADSWEDLGDTPPLDAAATCMANGKIYTFGGCGNFNATYEYDPSTNTWTQKADNPTQRVEPTAVLFDGKIFVMGGHTGFSPYNAISIIDVYDPLTDTWETTCDLPIGRCGPEACVYNGKIYVFGGYTGSWCSAIASSVVVFE
jgi:N-acetylneuraminic acid mutarotase